MTDYKTEAQKAFKLMPPPAPTMTEHGREQIAIQNNMERLRAERLMRERRNKNMQQSYDLYKRTFFD